MSRDPIEQFDRNTYDKFVAGHDDSDMGECEICGLIDNMSEYEIITDKSDGSKHCICNKCMEGNT